MSAAEWQRIDALLDDAARQRIRASAAAARPVVCPLLDLELGACLIYDARPIACRAYGFYAERDKVLGCHRIETIDREKTDVIWGNHPALELELDQLGPAAPLYEFLDRRSHPAPAVPDSTG